MLSSHAAQLHILHVVSLSASRYAFLLYTFYVLGLYFALLIIIRISYKKNDLPKFMLAWKLVKRVLPLNLISTNGE